MACNAQTPPSASANSYVTIAEGDEYFESHPYADDWTNALEAVKCRAIVTATRLIEASFSWRGYVVAESQPLAWPRYGIVDGEGRLIADNVVPTKVKHAAFETAISVIRRDVTRPPDSDVQGIQELKAGPVSLKFKTRPADAYSAFTFPDLVRTLLKDFVQSGSGNLGQIPLARG